MEVSNAYKFKSIAKSEISPCNLLTLPIEPFFFGEFSVQVVVSLQTNPRITGLSFRFQKKELWWWKLRCPQEFVEIPPTQIPFTKIQQPFTRFQNPPGNFQMRYQLMAPFFPAHKRRQKEGETNICCGTEKINPNKCLEDTVDGRNPAAVDR